ncbi:MAG: phosphoesterase [Lachnospiraceae bacterium]|nr:phosphoesterase [Lachnospiraceae bacterium]
MSVFFIADTHFDDDNIRRYENRPFEDTTQMNEAMIRNWNRIVAPSDIVYFLGDVGADSYVARLNGIKYLVKGNHDTASNDHYREIGFAEVYDLPVIYDSYWILSHEPLYINRNMPYANIFGHVHANPAYRDISSRSYCVSVERISYTPVPLERIRTAILEAQEREDTRSFQ